MSAGGERRRPPRPPDGRWTRTTLTAWTILGAVVLVSAVAIALDAGLYAELREEPVGPGRWLAARLLSIGFLVPALALAVTGTVIVARRARNTIGRVLLAAGTCLALTGLVRALARTFLAASTDVAPPLAAVAQGLEFPLSTAGFVLALVIVPLLFPDGRLPSRRWWPVVVLAGLLVVLDTLRSIFVPRLEATTYFLDGRSIQLYDVANPLAVGWVGPLPSIVSSLGALVTLGLVLAAVAAVVVRYRRSTGVERQQMKWFTFAAAVVGGLALTLAVGAVLGTFGWVQAAIGVTVASAYPVAIGIAVLRYRLYEIDRIISRTVTYGLVVALLAAVYATAVVALGAAVTAVTGVEDSDLVVAGATLLAAGLFGPIRTRVQTLVNRRFNRTSYEAAQAVDAFAQDVREEVEQEHIRRRTAETAATAVQPTHVSIWLSDLPGDGS